MFQFIPLIRSLFGIRSVLLIALFVTVLSLPEIARAQCTPTLSVVGNETDTIVVEGADFAWRYNVTVTCVDEIASPIIYPEFCVSYTPTEIGTDVTPDVSPYTQWGYVKGWSMRETSCRSGSTHKGQWQDSSPNTDTSDATYTLGHRLSGTTWDDHCQGNPTGASNSILWNYELKLGSYITSGTVNISRSEDDTAVWKPECS